MIVASESSTMNKGLKERMTEYEKNLILEALSQSGGNQRRAASMLGVLPTTLHEKMKRLGLISRREPELVPLPAASYSRFSPATY